jgi:hypothetical protein
MAISINSFYLKVVVPNLKIHSLVMFVVSLMEKYHKRNLKICL